LRDKRLRDVCEALKVKGFSATEKPPKRLPKNSEPLKIKHLMNFFSVFRFAEKTHPPSPPTRPPVGTIFAVKNTIFSIHFCKTEKLKRNQENR
jgi:hypothetical protein